MRCAVVLMAAVGLWGQAAPYDVVISGARVVDGSGSPWFLADIGIRGDTIAAVGALGNASAAVRIDALRLAALVDADPPGGWVRPTSGTARRAAGAD